AGERRVGEKSGGAAGVGPEKKEKALWKGRRAGDGDARGGPRAGQGGGAGWAAGSGGRPRGRGTTQGVRDEVGSACTGAQEAGERRVGVGAGQTGRVGYVRGLGAGMKRAAAANAAADAAPPSPTRPAGTQREAPVDPTIFFLKQKTAYEIGQ